jgi:hypothetical protein
MILEGLYKVKYSGLIAYVNKQIFKAQDHGFRIHKMKKRIDWPYFWRYRFTVTMVKDIIVDSKHITETPLTGLL